MLAFVFRRPGLRRPVLAALVCLLSALFAGQGHGIDPSHDRTTAGGWHSPFAGAGASGASAINLIPGVWAQAIWDDGRGPALYAAGNFVTMDDVYSPGIARWDGLHWERVPLPGDPDLESRFAVWSMVEFQGDLIVGGSFLAPDGKSPGGILRYDGQGWHPLAGSQGAGVGGTVQALAVYQDELIVGGEFSQAGGVPVNGLARWSGNEWQTLANPFQASATVRALAVYQGELIAGGSIQSAAPAISRVARWNGSAWQQLAGPSGQGVAQDPGFGSAVNALHATPAGLFVGGRFASAGGVPARNVARWDGAAWNALGAGVGNVTHQVHALQYLDGLLHVGGSFPGSAAVASPNAIAWDGSQWLALAGPGGAGTDVEVLSLAAFDDALFLGGLFGQAGGVLSTAIARWTGSEFARVSGTEITGPMGGAPRTLLSFAGHLVAAGSFTQAGTASSARIAAWDGTGWLGLAGGFAGGQVNALVEFEGSLIAAGAFNFALDPGSPTALVVNRVARWDGSGWQAMANGLGGTVEALHVYQGQLYAAGSFTAAGGFGGAPMARIARWTGSAWEAVDGGLGNGSVLALHSHEGELIAGGGFTQLGDGTAALRMARWNPTEGWRPLGPGLSSGVVRTLASLDGALYAGGSFGAPPTGTSPRFLARWDGAAWQPVTDGAGQELSWQVGDMVVRDDELVLGGGFERIGELDLHCVARYSPADGWRQMGGPQGIGLRRNCGGVDRLLLLGETVVAAGPLIVAGGQVAHRIAYWSPPADLLFRDGFEPR